MKTWFVFLLLLCVLIPSGAQEMETIFLMHQDNTQQLYHSRGISADRVVSYKATMQDLVTVLKDYPSNTGLLIYTHLHDSLSIVLITNNGDILTEMLPYKKDSLIMQVNMANLWFSEDFKSRGASKRGEETTVTYKSRYELWLALERINKALLPFKGTLANLDHLIILPTLNIGTLPFAALKISETSYLIDHFSYSIAPSLSEIVASKQRNIELGISSFDEIHYEFTSSLFVANPSFPYDSFWIFPDLPGAEREVEFITNKLNESSYTALIKEQATKANIEKNICDYDLLYFATHGISDILDPLENSFLVFAENGNESCFLTAKEIQDFGNVCELNADLVVLSACQTGLGKTHEGGVIGLSRAFQLAGAKHVVMSLWSINDEETANLMSMFFDFLKTESHMMPHEAMRRAIVRYKNEINSNPVYWASFSILGIPY